MKRIRRRQRQRQSRQVVRIAATAAAIAYVCTKRKVKKSSEQQSPIVARYILRYMDGSNALLYEPIVNFSAKFYCLAANKIAAFC